MIDRESRRKFSEALRSLSAGLISNDQFEEVMPPKSPQDVAIQEIFSKGAWTLYSDLKEYRLVEEHRLNPDTKSAIARWILFLQTDLPYEWPIPTVAEKLRGVVLDFFTFGISTRRAGQALRNAGDIDVWPFIRKADYEEALRHPRYLRNAL